MSKSDEATKTLTAVLLCLASVLGFISMCAMVLSSWRELVASVSISETWRSHIGQVIPHEELRDLSEDPIASSKRRFKQTAGFCIVVAGVVSVGLIVLAFW